MIRLVIVASLVASLLAGCRISLENNDTADDTMGRRCMVSTTSQPCMDSVNHSDFAWIQKTVFTASCNFSGCHGSASDAGKLDLGTMSHDHLVDVSSQIDASRKLVVPNDVPASYLMLMLGDVPPAMANPPGTPPPTSIGFMPQAQPTLCCQKLDAIDRWIMDGAPNN